MSKMIEARVGKSWAAVIGDEFKKEYMRELATNISKDRIKSRVYPSQGDVFHAFRRTPYDKVKVVIMGASPSPFGGSNGVAFERGDDRPTREYNSLLAAYQEAFPSHFNTELLDGSLLNWTNSGVLLLNAALTCRHGLPYAHIEYWSEFIKTVIESIKSKSVFVFIGSLAQKHSVYVGKEHTTFCYHEWKASDVFADINRALITMGHSKIKW